MRILVVSPYSPRDISGISVFITELAKVHAQKGNETFLISPKSEKPEIDLKFFSPNKNLKEINIPIPVLRNLFLGLSTALNIVRMRKKIDIIHLHQPHFQTLAAGFKGKIIGKPVVTTYHVNLANNLTGFRRFLQLQLNRLVSKVSNRVVFVSESARRDFGIKGIIVKNGVDIKRFSPEGRVISDSFVMIYVGRISRDKGMLDLIESLASINNNGINKWELLLVGQGSESFMEEFRNRVNQLGLSSQIKELGTLGKEIVDYYRKSDLFVLPSYLEGMPISLLESMACGTPPLATNVGGVKEVIKDGENGFIIHIGDSTKLTKKIIWCMENREELLKAGRNAVMTVENEFNIQDVASNYLELFNSTVQNSDS
jgi:glycosyltransferase involved in cell wall biosynthesis